MDRRSLFAAVVLAGGLCLGGEASAARTLEEYRYFRALSIDLNGRVPTRAEVAAFERPDFDLAAWIDQRLAGPAYAERVRRIYMDLLRLELGGVFTFNVPGHTLRRITVQGPRGPEHVYFRTGQRRTRAETDGTACFTPQELGIQLGNNGVPDPACNTPRAVSQALLDERTVLVRPWWLYQDYRSTTPAMRYDATAWAARAPTYLPVRDLQVQPDGVTPVTAVRVCREEAQTGATGTIYAPGRRPLPPAEGCNRRITSVPADSAYARDHAGEGVACASSLGYMAAANCGCGPGLERCLPSTGFNSLQSAIFQTAVRAVDDPSAPLVAGNQTQAGWERYWWAREAVRFLDGLFAEDRDFREALTARYTYVNGPLAQFYRSVAPYTQGARALEFGYAQPEPLVNPAALPGDLAPFDTDRWRRVDDRGPHAAGLLTMPIFLTKYGTRRARAHVVYNAFLCREFVAENVALRPSEEPNLMVRDGCAACHATLEPLSAYFTRVAESDWTFLPAERFPLNNTRCATGMPGATGLGCRTFYDPSFTNARQSLMRGAYGSMTNANAGPRGLAAHVTVARAAEFTACVAENVATSFLGHPPDAEDAPLLRSLGQTFASGGYRVRALVRALVLSDAYRRANNLSSSAWRDGSPDAGGAR